MTEEESDIIVVGNGKVGKTSLIRRFTTGEYDDKYKKTIGAAFKEKILYIKRIEKKVKFLLWDTAGQEEFDSVTRRYYRGAGGCIYAFSLTDRDSFEAIKSWTKKVKDECGDVCSVLIQNKMDLFAERVVEPEETEELAKSLGLSLIKTCVKNNEGVDEVFNFLACEYSKIQKSEDEQFGIETFKIPDKPKNSSKKNKCLII